MSTLKAGDSSWELDAIDPRNLASLVSDAIQELIEDPGAWDATINVQTGMTDQLITIANQLEGNA